MARPSSFYPSERPGQTCGASWSDPLRVTGKIPGKPFGAQHSVDLAPVADADDMRWNLGLLSWRGEHETRVRADLEDTIDQVRADADKFRQRIGEDNYQAVRNLLALALAELAYVDITHEKWVERRFGLDRNTYSPECSGPNSLPPGAVYGGGFERCPTMAELEERTRARQFIVDKFVDACHFIRCAQFGLWRVWLYRLAVEEWNTTPQGGAPDGLAPTPPKPNTPPFGAGSFTAQPPGPPPPPTPPAPDPLPPFPTDLGDGIALPDPGEPEPPDEDAVPQPEPEPVGGTGSPLPPLPTEPPRPDISSDSAEVDAAKEFGEDFLDTADSINTTTAVAAVATTAIVVGGIVGIVYLRNRNKKGSRR